MNSSFNRGKRTVIFLGGKEGPRLASDVFFSPAYADRNKIIWGSQVLEIHSGRALLSCGGQGLSFGQIGTSNLLLPRTRNPGHHRSGWFWERNRGDMPQNQPFARGWLEWNCGPGCWEGRATRYNNQKGPAARQGGQDESIWKRWGPFLITGGRSVVIRGLGAHRSA